MRQTRFDEELTAPQVALIIGHNRQTAWHWLSRGRIKNARRVAGRWWVASREDVIAAKRLRDRACDA